MHFHILFSLYVQSAGRNLITPFRRVQRPKKQQFTVLIKQQKAGKVSRSVFRHIALYKNRSRLFLGQKRFSFYLITPSRLFPVLRKTPCLLPPLLTRRAARATPGKGKTPYKGKVQSIINYFVTVTLRSLPHCFVIAMSL